MQQLRHLLSQGDRGMFSLHLAGQRSVKAVEPVEGDDVDAK